MRAIVQDRYGPPEVLRLEDVPTPTPGPGAVLVRVHAASLNAGDWHLMRADPFLVRLTGFGFLRPKHPTLGSDMAGTVEAVGADVDDFAVGDEVFGDLSANGFGAFAEFVCAPASAFAGKPAGLTFQEAAALPGSGLAALQALRKAGGVEPGQQVLVNGASGGVGTFAVQIARSRGATVTGVCSTSKLDLVRSLGADRVVDYTQEDVTQGAQAYDVIIDAGAYRSVLDYRRVLTAQGAYVMVGGAASRLLQLTVVAPFVSRSAGRTFHFVEVKPDRDDLLALRALAESGEIRPVIDRTFTLDAVPDAIRYLEAGRARGKVVIAL